MKITETINKIVDTLDNELKKLENDFNKEVMKWKMIS